VRVGDTKEVVVTVEHARNLFGPITGVGGKQFVPPAAEVDGPSTPRPNDPKTGN